VLILGRLRGGASSVGELAAAVGMEPSAVSHQLRLLRHLGFVVGRRERRRMVYDLHGGRRLGSPALIADGHHASSDALVSLGVILSAIVVALGAPIADPLIGLAITAMILRITWESWRTVTRASSPGA
jgi:Co/Zn/Cd efflux system component